MPSSTMASVREGQFMIRGWFDRQIEGQGCRLEGKLSPRVRGKQPYSLRKWRVGT
jgi:hypothetical protein